DRRSVERDARRRDPRRGDAEGQEGRGEARPAPYPAGVLPEARRLARLMRSFAIVAVTFAAAACGDPPLPGQQTSLQTLTAGPVTIVIDPLAQSFTLTLASPTPLVTDHFLSVGKTDTVDPTHY